MKSAQLYSKTCFFPLPFQDELLDSVIFRYHHLSGNYSPGITLQKLFGRFSGAFPRVLVSRIDHLLKRLPTNLFSSVDDIIDNHSLLPAFSRVYDKRKMVRLWANSYGGAAIGMNFKYRYCRNTKVISDAFQYCPVCVLCDTEQFGTAYWHRSHQLNGAVVCHVHGCDLISTCPCCRRKLYDARKMEIPTSYCKGCGTIFPLTYSYPAPVQHLAKLAHQALHRTVDATDLLLFARVILGAASHDTYHVCQTAERLYGMDYLRNVAPTRFAACWDWLQDSFEFSSEREETGLLLLNFPTFAEALMTVDVLFGSWKNMDRAVDALTK